MIVILPLDSANLDRAAERQARETECETVSWPNVTDTPLRVQQSKLDGWWFIFVDEVPGLGVLGPNYEDLLDRLKVVAGNVFRARGETVTDIKIIPSEKPALQVLH